MRLQARSFCLASAVWLAGTALPAQGIEVYNASPFDWMIKPVGLDSKKAESMTLATRRRWDYQLTGAAGTRRVFSIQDEDSTEYGRIEVINEKDEEADEVVTRVQFTPTKGLHELVNLSDNDDSLFLILDPKKAKPDLDGDDFRNVSADREAMKDIDG